MARDYMARATSSSRSSSQDRKSDRDSSSERPNKQTSSDSSMESNTSPNRTSQTVVTKLDIKALAIKKPMLGGNVVSRTESMQLVDQLADLQSVIDSLEETPFGRDEEEDTAGEEKVTVKAAEVNGEELVVLATDDIILEEDDDAEEMQMEERDKVQPIRPSPPLSPKGKVSGRFHFIILCQCQGTPCSHGYCVVLRHEEVD